MSKKSSLVIEQECGISTQGDQLSVILQKQFHPEIEKSGLMKYKKLKAVIRLETIN